MISCCIANGLNPKRVLSSIFLGLVCMHGYIVWFSVAAGELLEFRKRGGGGEILRSREKFIAFLEMSGKKWVGRGVGQFA